MDVYYVISFGGKDNQARHNHSEEDEKEKVSYPHEIHEKQETGCSQEAIDFSKIKEKFGIVEK